MTCFVQNQQKITDRTMFFMSKQVSLPKISLIQQKYENQPKKRYTPFLHETLQL